jgi:hypothetical protein
MPVSTTILFLTINIIFLATNYLLAQICQNDIPDKWENSRYTDHGDGTVTDKQTTLMWKKCIQGLSGNDCSTGTSSKYNWAQALQLGGSSFSSYNDWRLPPHRVHKMKKNITKTQHNMCWPPH